MLFLGVCYERGNGVEMSAPRGNAQAATEVAKKLRVACIEGSWTGGKGSSEACLFILEVV
jgi:hypothetical protein